MNAPELDLTLTALADPTRRAILQRLSRGEARITELAKPFPISLNSVSKHIRILERAKLVKRRRAGRDHYLSFNSVQLDAAISWITDQRAFWMSSLQAMDDLLLTEVHGTSRIKDKRKGKR